MSNSHKNLERSLWFIGYGNEDTVWLQDLRQSKGEAARRQQSERAEVVDNVDVGDGPASSSVVWPHSGIWLLNNWYFVTKIVLTYCEKKLFYWSRKTFEIRGWRPRICNFFEISRTIYSSSERSEQFLVTECFFNLFLEVSQL